MMNDVVDPLQILEGASPELEKTLEDPFSVNFRGKDKELEEIHPDQMSFSEAHVDLANQNVELKTNLQDDKEGYTTVMYGEGIALVESKAEIKINEKTGISTVYYLVTDEKTLLYNDNHWEEVYNPSPRDVANLTPELYEQAKYAETEDEQNDESNRSPVPPPKEDRLME